MTDDLDSDVTGKGALFYYYWGFLIFINLFTKLLEVFALVLFVAGKIETLGFESCSLCSLGLQVVMN